MANHPRAATRFKMLCSRQMKLAALVFLAPVLLAETRPKILGVAHINLGVSDLEKSRAFYKDFLGYQEPFDLTNPDGSTSLAFIKINDRQYVELSPKLDPAADRLRHISIETDDAEGLRRYLASRGVKVPATVRKAAAKIRTSTSRIPTIIRWRSFSTSPTAGRCARRASS